MALWNHLYFELRIFFAPVAMKLGAFRLALWNHLYFELRIPNLYDVTVIKLSLFHFNTVDTWRIGASVIGEINARRRYFQQEVLLDT